MNKFEKFMVVPYKPRHEEESNPNKIDKILNNYSLNKSDKAKLIDQLIVENSQTPSTEETNQNNSKPFFNFDNPPQKNKKQKKVIENNNDLDQVNKKINEIKKTKNNAQLFLAPSASTRNNTKNINDDINISLDTINSINKSISNTTTRNKSKLLEKIDKSRKLKKKNIEQAPKKKKTTRKIITEQKNSELVNEDSLSPIKKSSEFDQLEESARYTSVLEDPSKNWEFY